jgi:gliding motility-associated-like protein
MIKKYLFLGFALIVNFSLFSQLAVNTGQTALQYVTNNLIGSGVTVSNVTFTGGATQIGDFSDATSNIGFQGGIVLSSGDVTELVGVSTTQTAGTIGTSGISDNSLLSVAQSVTTNPSAASITSTKDLAALEFDFVAVSNVVSFNFVFGSDEYLTYVNTVFNDVFGFFVSGPGITGPYASPAGFPNGSVNLAVVPNTNLPITISTIHPGLNAQYYVPGGPGNTLNGYTTPIPITFNVQCGETYHFKFAVADCQDNYLSTAVFLQDDSFFSPPVGISLQTANGTDTIPEACVDANVLFIRSACQSNLPLTVNFSVTGTAIDDVDFILADSPIILAPGQDTAAINIAPIVDGIAEGTESIIITVSYVDANGYSLSVSGNLYLTDITPLNINTPDISLQCFNDNILLGASASGATGSYTYDWLNSSSDSTQDVVSVNQNGVFYFPITVTDACLGSLTDTVTVTMNQTIIIDTIYTALTSCQPTGFVAASAIGLTGTPTYSWTGPGPNGFSNDSLWQNIPSGWYYLTVQDNVCSMSDSAFVGVKNAADAEFNGTPIQGCAPFDVTFQNNSLYANNYSWNFGDTQTATSANLTNVSHTYTGPFGIYSVQLIAFQSALCSDTAYYLIQVDVCGCTDPIALNYNVGANVDNGTCVYQTGCTDPNALNYNASAIIDDGSCAYPTPIVEAPNVFTPGNDGNNDAYFLSTKNVVKLELTIFNRWGNVIFEKSSDDLVNNNPSWDGKINGVIANEGVYFYEYTGYNISGQEVTGHGFLHLVAK